MEAMEGISCQRVYMGRTSTAGHVLFRDPTQSYGMIPGEYGRFQGYFDEEIVFFCVNELTPC